MTFLIGFVTIIACVLGGYILHHGKLIVLYQPTEYLIIVGAAIGSMIIGNPGKVLGGSVKNLKLLFKAGPFKKQDYLDLLAMLFTVCKLMKSKGMLAIESHLENPENSSIFGKYHSFVHHHHAVEFLCDNLRILTMGVDDVYEMEDRMNDELKVHHEEAHRISGAIQTMSEAFPAIGIVAAVLGVIVTMGSINEPPEILGGLIGAALVGTFLGVLLSYGFVGPMARYLGIYFEDEHVYMECIKTVLLSHMKGNAPIISVEMARKKIGSKEKPTFKELEDACNSAGASSE